MHPSVVASQLATRRIKRVQINDVLRLDMGLHKYHLFTLNASRGTTVFRAAFTNLQCANKSADDIRMNEQVDTVVQIFKGKSFESTDTSPYLE